ncbi:DNA dC-_dU-editing enzyme APOBEC-3G-like [Ursus arctos]|uniref:DNA dC->dU-editing enzyme APOBEC-3G-like n=1 Tax=Ursus arctos TaxID=9644 RepID=UPI002546AC9C|nr:DNA dC->dU-editing enzyme APOBEC-3G-like [Ursus arctos]
MDAGREAWDRHLLDEDTFNENFRNDDWPSRTYLCYKVEGPIQGSGVPLGQDKGILRNKGPEPSCHAECYLLEQIQSWNLDPKLHYGVTCFLSWSPCAKCAQKMARFLQENSHVSLKLFASRLYTREQYDENYKEGLRTLKRAGASIAIMTYREFELCWKTFVLHDQEGSCFQPWPFLHKESQKFSEKLQAILQMARSWHRAQGPPGGQWPGRAGEECQPVPRGRILACDLQSSWLQDSPSVSTLHFLYELRCHGHWLQDSPSVSMLHSFMSSAVMGTGCRQVTVAEFKRP